MDLNVAPGVRRHPDHVSRTARVLAAAALAAVVVGGLAAAPAPTTGPSASAKKAAATPASRPALRTPDAVREALAGLLGEARSAADKEGVKTVVVLASLGHDAAGPLPAFLQQTLLDAFDGGPAVAPPPAAVKAPPSPLNPATLSRLRWPMKDPKEVKASKDAKDSKDLREIPTVLAAVATPSRDGADLALTLLDDKQVLWHGSLALSRQEIATLPLSPPINQKILAFAVAHRGEQVGNGECWTLADEAMKSAGTTHPETYVWGRPLAPGEPVVPGDVVQFTTVRLEKGNSWTTLGTPRHTALIEQVKAPGVYVLIHQNYNGRTVKETTVDLNTKTEGDFVIYRPLSPRGR